MLKDELANDKYGIGWTVIPQAQGIEGIKPISLAPGATDQYVMPSRASFADRSYPLTRSIFFYINRAPGSPVDPKVAEFIRYILSKDGQDAVARQGKYLPLPAAVAEEQLESLK
jgi:phosphate transport system substrate-binding protein